MGIYGQIHGRWFMDAEPGADLSLLRHDTVYGSVTENGVPIPFIEPSVSEIHTQTAAQRAANLTGPMVSLIHGMPSFFPGGCTCIPDPVGVPDVAASWAKGMSGMQYMGRIKLPKIEYLDTQLSLTIGRTGSFISSWIRTKAYRTMARRLLALLLPMQARRCMRTGSLKTQSSGIQRCGTGEFQQAP